MSKFNVGDTVYCLSGTEGHRFIRCGTVEKASRGRYWVSGYYIPLASCQIYATEQEAKIAYCNREVEDAQKALDNARARLSNAVGWRERAEAEAQE